MAVDVHWHSCLALSRSLRISAGETQGEPTSVSLRGRRRNCLAIEHRSSERKQSCGWTWLAMELGRAWGALLISAVVPARTTVLSLAYFEDGHLAKCRRLGEKTLQTQRGTMLLFSTPTRHLLAPLQSCVSH